MLQLDKSNEDALSRHASSEAQLTAIKSDTVALTGMVSSNHTQLSGGLRALGKDIKSHIDMSMEAKVTGSPEQRLTHSLYYPEHALRKDMVRPPWENTFTWIYGNASDSQYESNTFSEWLRGGSGIYWVSGKAGSGKSTLMAHILHDSHTHESLEAWCCGRPMFLLSYFFWRAGTSVQNSITGLLRSIAYQICSSVPWVRSSLMEKLMLTPEDLPTWNEGNLSILVATAMRLAGEARFCLLIDGLDEFEGDHDELVNFLFRLQGAPNAKCCVSSRPEVRLSDRLSSCENLRLEDLNLLDIRTYVSERLSQYVPPYSNIPWAVASAASGVFLWAAVVTGRIVQSYQSGEPHEFAIRHIESTPKEMTELFANMLHGLRDTDQSDLAKILLAIRSYHDGINISVALLAASSADYSLSTPREFV